MGKFRKHVTTHIKLISYRIFSKGHLGYGRKNPNRRLSEEDSSKIDFGVFDLTDLKQLQECILIGMSGLMGFRGSQEHTELTVDQIINGVFSPDHPSFPNHEWWGVSHINKDKTMKLNMATNHVRETGGVLCRFPVLQDDASRNFGGALKLYRSLVPDSKKTKRIHRRISQDGKRYLPDSPIGKTKIRSLFKSGLARMGVSNQSVFPHALRAWFTTILANDPSVSATETMMAARHSSVEASAIYQSTSTKSENNRLRALLRMESDETQTNNETCNENQIVEIESQRDEEYSEFTQHQVDSLYNELNRLEENRRRRSQREEEIISLRRRVQEIERQRTLTSYPFNSPQEESDSLYQESLEEEARLERNRRIRERIQRRRRIMNECRRGFWGNLI